MIFIHESNLLNKIRQNYNGKGKEIEEFYNNTYLKVKEKLLSIPYYRKNIDDFRNAAKIIDDYLTDVENFGSAMNISSQSKFRSTFVEEISAYLFSSLPLIKNGTFGVFNKNIYTGMKINNQMHIDIIYKDVDFCIGKKVNLLIDGEQSVDIIIPIVCVEVKTYLDATMFGEVQFSSKLIKNSSPNVKTYVLMEYNDVSKEKIIAARYDNILNEMFVLRGGSRHQSIFETPLSPETLLEYYKEIKVTVENTESTDDVVIPGRLIAFE